MRVLVSDALSEQGLAILRQTPGATIDYQPGLSEADLAAAIPGADALVIRSGSKVTARVIEAATTLKVIGRHQLTSYIQMLVLSAATVASVLPHGLRRTIYLRLL